MNILTTYAATVTVPLPDDDVVKMFAGTGAHFAGVIDVVKAIFGPDGINPKHRQMCMMRVAKAIDSTYEWQLHAAIGRNLGLSEDEIAASASDGPVTGIHSDYVLLGRAAEELANAKTVTDKTLGEFDRALGQAGASGAVRRRRPRRDPGAPVARGARIRAFAKHLDTTGRGRGRGLIALLRLSGERGKVIGESAGSGGRQSA
jgi:hypothetical protein